MTKDKARKAAARARAADTGERYVVARRAVEPTAEVVEPPVPTGEGQPLAHHPRNRVHTHRPHVHRPRVHKEPRMLVAWQNRIARFFGAT